MTIPKKRFRITRDTVLFGAGLLGLLHEVVVTAGERPTLLILFAGMMGLPAFINKDERNKEAQPSEKVDGSNGSPQQN